MESYEIQCPTCGKILDKRNPGQILSHGWKNPQTGKYECLEKELEIQHSGATKKGSDVYWPNEKASIAKKNVLQRKRESKTEWLIRKIMKPIRKTQ